MRIACVHVPQFALQCLIRIEPSLRGAAVAVVGAGFDPAAGARPSLALHSPIVLACSRAAWSLGVRLGMTASAARFVSSELRVVAADPQLERETVRAIADGLLGVSTVVDTGGRVAAGGAHLAMYCEVPSKTRGTSFGDRLLDLLDTFGLAARIGIADDRFTAWVAAAHGGVDGVSRARAGVPRDGAAVPRDGAGISKDSAGGLLDSAGVPSAGLRADRARIRAEGARVRAEGARVPTESARVAAESARVAAESAGLPTESARVRAESARVAAESAGLPTESARVRAESARVATESARVAVNSAGLLTESARIVAESATVPKASGGILREDRGVVIVPRGGSAAFLAPRPLSLLAITPEVQHMLEALGVRTLGEFAALPAPSVSRPLEADYQALARGDSGCTLRPYAPEAPIREELAVGNAGSLFGGATAVAALAERVALRLVGRARGAARLEVTITGSAGERVIPIATERATSLQDDLVELIAPLIGEVPGANAKLRVVVVGEAVAGAGGGPAGEVEAMPPIGAPSPAPSSAGSSMSSAQLADLGQLVALAHPHGQPWQLSAPQVLRSERRDAHRRTRRAKQRRRPVTLAQSQLFGNR